MRRRPARGAVVRFELERMSTQPLTTPVATPPTEGRRVGVRARVERLQGVIFVLPALIVLGLFLIYPMYYTTRLSFYKGDFLFNFFDWVGLDNFKDLLTKDPDFLDTSKFHGWNIPKELLYKNDGGALINNLHWVLFYISFSLAIGLSLAVLTVRVRYERAIKSAIFIPMAISATAVGIIWLFVYSPDPGIGVLNAVLHGVHLKPQSWLGNPNLVNYALIFAYIWASVGFVMVVLSAAIKGLPAEVMEAARVDGAGEWGVLWRVVIPMARPGIAAAAMFMFFACWNDYYGPYLYTSENRSNWTLSFALASFHGLHNVEWNLIMAAAVITVAPILLLFFFAQKAFVQGVTLTGVKG